MIITSSHFHKNWIIRCIFCISCIVNWLQRNDPRFRWAKKVIFVVFCLCFLHHFKDTFYILVMQFQSPSNLNLITAMVSSGTLHAVDHCCNWNKITVIPLHFHCNCFQCTIIHLNIFFLSPLRPKDSKNVFRFEIRPWEVGHKNVTHRPTDNL